MDWEEHQLKCDDAGRKDRRAHLYRSMNSMETSLKVRCVSRCRLMRDSASWGLSYAYTAKTQPQPLHPQARAGTIIMDKPYW